MLAAGLMFAAQAEMGRPGTVNFIEGQVTLDGQTIGASQNGKATAEPGQVLATRGGKAEMLLTPGVFLRLENNSAVRMVSPSLTDTRVELLNGEAMLEADQVQKENHLAVLDGGVNTLMEKHGVYEFRAGQQPTVAVFDGKAEVRQDDRTVSVGKGKELVLNQANLKPQKFDRDSAESTDDLYAWSKLRSEYVSQANMSLAQAFVVGGPSWYGPGWYWDPYFTSWAFMPGAGYLYSPFGWGFYSPAYWGTWGGYYGGYFPAYRYYRPGIAGRSYVGRGFVGQPSVSAAPRVSAPAPRFSAPTGGMRMGGFGGAHFGGRR